MMESEAGKAFAELIVIGMPVNQFYVTFGLRLDSTKELIQKLNTLS